MADPTTYAMLAIIADPTKVTLPTNTITRGQIIHKIATLNLTAHTRSILGRTYAQLLTDPDITQLNNNLTPLQYTQSKGLIGRPSDKINWATTLLGHTDVLQAYEEGLQEDQEEPLPPNNTDQQNKEKPPTPKNIPKTTPENRNKGKDKMPPMTRATPDPLKQMRQQQVAEAKLLAAENRQREGLRKEQEKIRAAEAAKKTANQDRLANKKTQRTQQQRTCYQIPPRSRRLTQRFYQTP
jgi:type IV secretory pathway VirB10-like protein